MDLAILIMILGQNFSGRIPIRPLKIYLMHPHIIHEDWLLQVQEQNSVRSWIRSKQLASSFDKVSQMDKRNPTSLKQDQLAQTWFSSACLNRPFLWVFKKSSFSFVQSRCFLQVSPKQTFLQVFLKKKKKKFFQLRVFLNKILTLSKYPEMSLDFLICESSHSSVKNLTKL